MLSRPPFRAPHHSASRTSLVGGGSGRIRPGELSRAHTGTLFLDEFPLFNADIIEALRQPLENGEVTINRGDEAATFPARTMVVIACNPCPCGDYHPGNRDNRCTCTELRRREYRKKLSGPVVDRIDIVRHVEPVKPHESRDPLARPEPTAAIRERVTAARSARQARYAGTDWRLNSDVPGSQAAHPLPAHRQRQPAARGPAVRRRAHRSRRHPRAPARLDRRGPPGRRAPGLPTRWTSPCGCGAATRCSWSRCARWVAR